MSVNTEILLKVFFFTPVISIIKEISQLRDISSFLFTVKGVNLIAPKLPAGLLINLLEQGRILNERKLKLVLQNGVINTECLIFFKHSIFS